MKYLPIFLLLLLPYSAFASITYERTPSGSEIDEGTAITIDVTMDNFLVDTGATTDEWWCVALFNQTLDSQESGTGDQHNTPIHYTDLSHSFTFNNPPLGEYNLVWLGTSATEECSNASINQAFINLEGDNFTTIFTVLPTSEEENPFSLLIGEGDTVMTTLTGENMGANVAYAGNTFYKPILGGGLLFLYVMRYWILALIIISAIMYFAYRKAYT